MPLKFCSRTKNYTSRDMVTFRINKREENNSYQAGLFQNNLMMMYRFSTLI